MILEHLHFCLANHACVSHFPCGEPHPLECYYRNCLIGTHMCVNPVSEWSVLCTLQCELFASCNVSNNASLVPAWIWGRGWSTKCGQVWSEGGDRGPKNSQICANIFYGWPAWYLHDGRHSLWYLHCKFFRCVYCDSVWFHQPKNHSFNYLASTDYGNFLIVGFVILPLNLY